MIVEAAPVVPLDEDRGRIPELALANGVHERGDPRWPVAAETIHVIGVIADRRDPGEVRKLAFANVGDELPVRRDDIVLPIRTIVDVSDGLIARPEGCVAAGTASIAAGVEPPRKFRLI